MSICNVQPLVSIIIPVFNGERFLAEAVESVRRQDYAPLEIITVDDGSTDGSREMAQKLPGVVSLVQPNSGPAAARNRGVRAANGTFLGFLDADDLWTKGKLKLQLEAFRNDPDVHLVAGRVEEFYSSAPTQQTPRLRRRSGDRAYTIGAMLIHRKDFLQVGPLTETLRFGEFLDWRLRALSLGMKEHVLDSVVLRRRIHDRNTTLHSPASQIDYLLAIKAHLDRKRSIAPGKSSPPIQSSEQA